MRNFYLKHYPISPWFIFLLYRKNTNQANAFIQKNSPKYSIQFPNHTPYFLMQKFTLHSFVHAILLVLAIQIFLQQP